MIELARISGPASIQDGGRRGHMHEGVPVGGALVPELLALANAAAGSSPGAAAIEAFGALTIVAREPVVVASDDGVARSLAPGERLELAAPRGARARYLAVRGGIDVPVVLGARATLVVAGLGGLDGRWLRVGDVLRAGGDRGAAASLVAPLDLTKDLRVVLGPDRDRFHPSAEAVLLGATFTISAASDRVGARLEGPELRRAGDDLGRSMPMARGAIQVPASGSAVVLGPDHPTTGGYPVIATIIRADLGSFAARRPGAAVRFHALVDP